MSNPLDILDKIFNEARLSMDSRSIQNEAVWTRIDYVARCLANRAGVRLLMACMLAKIHKPDIDPRQPSTEISSDVCFSGRGYDEKYITKFIHDNELPCNSTTAFLTPALRNIDRALTTDVVLIGRPPQIYRDTLQLLDDVANGLASAEEVLCDAIRILLLVRNEKRARMQSLLEGMKHDKDALPLSSEAIVRLIEQHLACRHSSRLPVLIVAAAYNAAQNKLGEFVRPLRSHNAADEQTGAIGDVEICLENEAHVVTAYEMKMKRVTKEDVNRAITKICAKTPRIDNYIFITTDMIDEEVRDYANSIYETTMGIEVAVLDCLGFLRHFLHLFHRIRIDFLDEYQKLLLTEPDSSVNQPLKEAFLTLRQAAESDE
jgi:hypothetical protein